MNRPTDDNWHPVADTGELDDEEALAVSVGRFHVALCRVGDRFYAIDNLCTHEFACMAEGLIDGDTIECPLHQAQFHIPTGKALTAPAEVDLATYPTKVVGEKIFIRLPE